MGLIRQQLAPSATTLSTLYTASADTISSSIVVCNRGNTSTTFRVAIRALGASIDNSHYLYFNAPLQANDTFIATIGSTILATDIVSVYAGNANLTFQLFGSEIS
jgi:hypothetical protein